jgi:hypothetical protein
MANIIRALIVVSLLSVCAWGQDCKLSFGIVWHDELNNFDEGLKPADAKWFQEKMTKKYPVICYVAPSQPATLYLFINLTPATYHGTRTITSTNDNPVSATVTDQSGYSSNVSGTVQTTTTTTVPNEFDYSVFTLSLEQKQPDGTFTVLRNFQRKGICPTLYGMCIKHRHPSREIVEDGVKWLYVSAQPKTERKQ